MELIHNTKKCFGENIDFQKIRKFTKNQKTKVVWHFWCFCKGKKIVIFYIGFGFVVLKSIW